MLRSAVSFSGGVARRQAAIQPFLSRPRAATFSIGSFLDELLRDDDDASKKKPQPQFRRQQSNDDAPPPLPTWPRRKSNWCVNFCRQGEQHVVERFGRLHCIRNPGLYFAVPLVDRIAYCVDMREKAIAIRPQPAVSKDNVSIEMSGVVYVQFTDAERAAYGHFEPLYAVVQHSQSAMRAAVGYMELDDLFHDRETVNRRITQAIESAAQNWGLRVLRYEVTNITPDCRIAEAMDKQAAAERLRRETVLKATGDKESAVLRSEGELTRRTNEAEARQRELEKEAAGRANAVLIEADAQQRAIQMVAAALREEGGDRAAHVDLARAYMAMMGEVGRASNTIFFGEQPGDMSAMMARVATAFQHASKPSSATTVAASDEQER